MKNKSETFASKLGSTLENVNKSELARVLGCHRDTVAKWLAGRQQPSVSYLLRLCMYLYPDNWEQAFLYYAVLIEQEK